MTCLWVVLAILVGLALGIVGGVLFVKTYFEDLLDIWEDE